MHLFGFRKLIHQGRPVGEDATQERPPRASLQIAHSEFIATCYNVDVVVTLEDGSTSELLIYLGFPGFRGFRENHSACGVYLQAISTWLATQLEVAI